MNNPAFSFKERIPVPNFLQKFPPSQERHTLHERSVVGSRNKDDDDDDDDDDDCDDDDETFRTGVHQQRANLKLRTHFQIKHEPQADP